MLEAYGANVTWNSQRAIVEVNMSVVSMIKNETIKYNDGSFYTGDTKHGIPNGEGTLTYGDGNFYIGNFVNGVFEGYGTYTSADGEEYRGELTSNINSSDSIFNEHGTYGNPHVTGAVSPYDIKALLLKLGL